jgi:hypothetical protein
VANYKVIHRKDLDKNRNEMVWEPGCPVLVEAIQVSRDTDTSEAYLQIKVQNICGETIDEITAEATVVYKTEPEQKIRIQELDCALRAGTGKALKPIKLAHGDATDATVTILSIDSQSIEWETSGEAKPVPKPAELPISETERVQLLKEKDIPAKAAKKLPVATNDWWVCGCGQITVGNRKCLACGSDLEDLLDLQDEKQLLDSIYERAANQESEGTLASLSSAKSGFESLGSYRDAARRVAECAEKINSMVYNAAVSKRAKRTELSLNYAIEAFESLGGYRDSSDQAEACKRELKVVKKEEVKGQIVAIGVLLAFVIVLITVIWNT